VIYYVAYAIPALIIGYIIARECFTGAHEDAPRKPSQFKTGNLSAALFMGTLWGLVWPITVVAFLIAWAMDATDYRRPGLGRRIGERIFGQVRR
jgi:hypothetical protein